MNLTKLARLLTAGLLSIGISGVAAADTIITKSGTFGPQSTDFSWSLDVDQTTGPGAGYHLTDITLNILSGIYVSTLTLTNTAGQNENFGLSAGALINITGNSASSDGIGDSDFIVFSRTIALGPSGSGVCPPGLPSHSCNVLSYAPRNLNDDYLFSIASANWGNYLGNGVITLTGNVAAYSAFNGGDNNIGLALTETGSVTATVTYDFAPDAAPGAPEPGTVVLLGSALLGVGTFRRYARR